ncbi:unnamed protein product [Didymodactylos carnosus]|uniref:Uncharacterized protein n=1 Tax=Didymodactylos carnosus TaxID=1234261 RepID=A0A8S2DFP8_9BILA|nr:unnamed protein product [Didymodactylos carnosus]CAF3667915.1 unnamed protein product [Didymodactylos carnosus]
MSFEVDVFVWFDDPRNRLFASFRTNVCMLEIKPEIKGRIMTHDKPIIAARYSTKQKQVMIVCQAGDVSFWSIEQGQKTKRFSERQGEADVTCIGFDEFGEKFYTGSSDGKIRVWNYNGRLIQTLDAGRGSACEISQIEALKRRIVAVGWSKRVLHLTVFRDVDQIEHNRGQTSTWLGKEVHEDDIVCMALTNFTPQLLATGSADGDICLWNTSSELFIRRLDQRKRNPNNTQAKLQDNAADFAITTLKFLDKRIQQSTNDGSNLVSCGGVGYTRFWNAYTGLLVAEFQAHSDVSSIVMEIDLKNKYLATGDVNGLVKVWEIEQYCRHTSDNLVKTLPPLLSEFTRHIDSITCLDFVEKDERTYLITSSSDCSVALSDVNGNIYGIFGQANNWRLDLQNSNDKDDRRQEENDDAESEQKITDSSDITSFRSTVDYDLDTISNMTDDEMLTRRSNVWDKTTIGVSYQERRTHGRRQRNQPGLIQTKQFALWEKTGLAPGGAYGSLETFDLPVILDPKKTSVTDNSYFLQRGSVEPLSSGTRRRPPSVIGENLKSAFDERSIFPKYILDYEAKQRQLNELTNTQQQTTNEKTVLRPIDSIRATTIKRLNSSSTYSEQN